MGNLHRPQASLTAKYSPPCDARVKNFSSPLYFPDTTFFESGSKARTAGKKERQAKSEEREGVGGGVFVLRSIKKADKTGKIFR